MIQKRREKAKVVNPEDKEEITLKTKEQVVRVGQRKRDKIQEHIENKSLESKTIHIISNVFYKIETSKTTHHKRATDSHFTAEQQKIDKINQIEKRIVLRLWKKYLWEDFTLEHIQWRVRGDYYEGIKFKIWRDYSYPYESITKFIDELKIFNELLDSKRQDFYANCLFKWNCHNFTQLEEELEKQNIHSQLSTEIIEESLKLYLVGNLNRQFTTKEEDRFNMIIRVVNHYLEQRWNDKINLKRIFESTQHLIDWYNVSVFYKLIQKTVGHISYDQPKRTQLLQNYFNSIQYDTDYFYVQCVNDIEEVKQRAKKIGVKLDYPDLTPLETYYIHRLRTPEDLMRKYSNENFFNGYEWTIGYDDHNMANIETLEKMLIESTSQLTRSEVLNIDIRTHYCISQEQRFDLHETVPIRVGLAKVEVICYGSRKNISAWYYLLLLDHKKKIFKLIYDDSVQNTELLQERYQLYDYQILGGGFMKFNKQKQIVEIRDKSEKYEHEPRIITIWAIWNALKLRSWNNWQIFLWRDGYAKISDYQ